MEREGITAELEELTLDQRSWSETVVAIVIWQLQEMRQKQSVQGIVQGNSQVNVTSCGKFGHKVVKLEYELPGKLLETGFGEKTSKEWIVSAAVVENVEKWI